MLIYCDGIFDLFHIGHLNHFRKIHSYFEMVYGVKIQLLVGIISDNVAETYKRRPVLNEHQRFKMISSLVCVHDAIITDMLVIDEEFINTYKVDHIVHSFCNPDDKQNQHSFFEVPIRLNKFIEIPYNYGVSTTDIIDTYYTNKPEKCIKAGKLDWKDIWVNKGNEETNDLYTLNGWESTNFDSQKLVSQIIRILNIQPNNKIMEYGCGAGLLSLYLKDYEYYGLDNSITLVSKHIKLLNNIVFNFDCTEVLFKSNYFDYVIINSMLEYLNSMEDVSKTIAEIERISIKGVYIANVRQETHVEKKSKHKYDGVYNHLTIQKEYFINRNYTIIDSLYDKERYDVYKIFV